MQVYLLRVTRELDDWKEKGERDVAWISFEEAVQRLTANTNIPERKNKKEKLRLLFKKATAEIERLEARRAPKTPTPGIPAQPIPGG